MSFQKALDSRASWVSFFTDELSVAMKDSGVTVQETGFQSLTRLPGDRVISSTKGRLCMDKIISKLRCFMASQLNHKLSQLATSQHEK